jgi:hypothetical protein
VYRPFAPTASLGSDYRIMTEGSTNLTLLDLGGESTDEVRGKHGGNRGAAVPEEAAALPTPRAWRRSRVHRRK